MSDAQGVSARDDTAPLPMAANPAATSRAERASSGRLVRLLATIGALAFAYAAWLPWAFLTFRADNRLPMRVLLDPSGVVLLGHWRLGDLSQSLFILAAFSMLGLLLAPLLWRPADSLLGAIASHIFGLWVIFATVLVVTFGVSPLISGGPQPVLPPSAFVGGTTTGAIILGFWVAVAALVPLWVAVIGLLVSEWRRHAFWHLPGNDEDSSRSLIQLPGAAVLNLGLIIWAFGFLSMGWAAVNCTQSPLFISSCQGTPASSAVSIAISQAISNIAIGSATDPRVLLYLDPEIAHFALNILLAGGAVMIFLGVWLRAVTRAFCIWTTLWLAAAVALVGLAYSGVGAIIAHPTQYGLAAGNWTVQSGVFITLIGLILALIGLATLSVAALRRKTE